MTTEKCSTHANCWGYAGRVRCDGKIAKFDYGDRVRCIGTRFTGHVTTVHLKQATYMVEWDDGGARSFIREYKLEPEKITRPLVGPVPKAEIPAFAAPFEPRDAFIVDATGREVLAVSSLGTSGDQDDAFAAYVAETLNDRVIGKESPVAPEYDEDVPLRFVSVAGHRNGCQGCDHHPMAYPSCWTKEQVDADLQRLAD